MSHDCTATHDADHDAATATLSKLTVGGFQHALTALNLCEAAAYTALLTKLMNEIAAHIREPADFVKLLAATLEVSVGLRLVGGEIVTLSEDEVTHLRAEGVGAAAGKFKIVETTPLDPADTVH